MSIVDKIKDYFKEKSAAKFAKKVSDGLLPKILEKAKRDLVNAAEDALKEKLTEMASELVEGEIDKIVTIPEKMQNLKSKIIEMAVEKLVDAAYDQVKEAVLGK